MLDKGTVLGKTDSGREAIANRSHNLNPRQRALLISINGGMNVGELLARFGAGSPDAALSMLDSLLERGLVAVLNEPRSAAAPADAVRASKADRVNMPADAPLGSPMTDTRVYVA